MDYLALSTVLASGIAAAGSLFIAFRLRRQQRALMQERDRILRELLPSAQSGAARFDIVFTTADGQEYAVELKTAGERRATAGLSRSEVERIADVLVAGGRRARLEAGA
jgi:hypothetical protein